jgi:S1-C subfamily serine protease
MSNKFNKNSYKSGAAIIAALFFWAAAFWIAHLNKTINVADQSGNWQPTVAQSSGSSAKNAFSQPALLKAVAIAAASRQNKPQVLGASVAAAQSQQLSQEEISDLSRPAMVHIINHVTGAITIPDFKVDLYSFAMTPDYSSKDNYSKDYDEVLIGSGFFINDSGYIVTNSHVVSAKELANNLYDGVISHMQQVIQTEAGALSKADRQKYFDYMGRTYPDDTAVNKLAQLFQQNASTYIWQKMQDATAKTIKVVNPNLALPANATLDMVAAKSFPANILSVNQNYPLDNKDVALVKIDQSNVPALQLGSSENLNSGQAIYILGFPENARVSSSDFIEPVFTNGVISAIKEDYGSKLIELNAKVGEGSSGGPVIDSGGNVVGIIATLTGDAGAGDTFSQALPIELVKDMLSTAGISNTSGTFRTNFMAGLAAADQSRCKSAVANFQAAKLINVSFADDRTVDKYINNCENLITSGLSQDSFADIAKHYINSLGPIFWSTVSFGLVVLLVLIGVIMHLRKVLKQKQALEPAAIPLPPSLNLKI